MRPHSLAAGEVTPNILASRAGPPALSFAARASAMSSLVILAFRGLPEPESGSDILPFPLDIIKITELHFLQYRQHSTVLEESLGRQL
jgi:hypothetical protein